MVRVRERMNKSKLWKEISRANVEDDIGRRWSRTISDHIENEVRNERNNENMKNN